MNSTNPHTDRTLLRTALERKSTDTEGKIDYIRT